MDSKPNIADLTGSDFDVVPFKPVWQPYNKTAITLLDTILKSLPHVPSSPTRFNKYKTVVASFLAIAQTVAWKENGALAIPKTRSHWSEYPDVGASMMEYVRSELEEGEFITQVARSGQRHFYNDDDGKLQWIGIQALYTISDSLYNLEGFTDAEWIEVGRPTVLVSKFESFASKIVRKERGERKPKMAIKKMINTFRRDYTLASKEVERLNTFWKQHPLALPPLGNKCQQYTSCSTRVYHDGSMDSGGRYYSSYTNLSTQYRLQSKIDGEEIVEIDINASQPTLFSSLMGMKMEVGKTWNDLYTDIIKSNVNLKAIDESEEIKRRKLKQVTVEIIGSGNPTKVAPAATGDLNFSKEPDEYGWYRNQLLRSVPALNLLNQNYLNGSGFVSFHEAEIMAATLKALMDLDVVAYPMHDCLIVKKSNQEIGVKTYRNTITDYILNYCTKNNKNKISISVPVSIEELGKDKLRLHGSYNS